MSAVLWSHREVRESVAAAVIHHMGAAKPWKRSSEGRRLFELEEPYRAYQRFLDGTPWEGWLQTQWTRTDLRKNVRYHLRDVIARLRRLPTRSSPCQRRLLAAAVLCFLREARFADVEQGIVDGSALHVRPLSLLVAAR
jgi:lipopolysaccharide biosynthesis glycosyltransferase